MNNKIYITFDKSNEDIATLVIFTESWMLSGPTMTIQNIITGQRAIELWNELNKKGEVKND